MSGKPTEQEQLAPKPERAKDQRLTDDYAAEARKDELVRGDELSELEPVGRKPAVKRRVEKRAL